MRSVMRLSSSLFALFMLAAALVLLAAPPALQAAPQSAQAGFDQGVEAFENEDYAQALQQFLPLAKAGQPAAITYVGRIHEEQDKLAEAAAWYLKAAQKGYAEAQTRLGNLYDAGAGVPQDEARAVEWYGKAAAQGDDEAQLALGEHAEDDLNDISTAQKWYEKAAAQSNATAQYRLGLLLISDDTTITRDVPRAWMLFTLAAEQGLDDADRAGDVLELEMEPVELRQAKTLLEQWKKTH